jgi:hypothetical protein
VAIQFDHRHFAYYYRHISELDRHNFALLFQLDSFHLSLCLCHCNFLYLDHRHLPHAPPRRYFSQRREHSPHLHRYHSFDLKYDFSSLSSTPRNRYRG